MPHSDGTVSITVNGAHRRVNAGLTLAQLATELGLVPETVSYTHLTLPTNREV